MGSVGVHSAAMGLIAVVWHFWIAPILTALTVLAVVGTILGYLFQVSRARYPRD
jgi:hypothetical protein